MATKKEAPALPKTLAAAADKLYTLREQRYALNKQVAALESQEAELRDHIIANLPKSEASGITGKVAHAEIVKKVIAQVKDWPTFYKHILKTKDFSLMQKRVNDGAVQEQWAAKKVVPGTEKFTAVTLSITKK